MNPAARCECSGSVRTGVESFTVDLPTQEVVVKTGLPYDTVLERIKKTGKSVRTRLY